MVVPLAKNPNVERTLLLSVSAKRSVARSMALSGSGRHLSQKERRAQWVDATLACSLAAGVLKPKVSLGR